MRNFELGKCVLDQPPVHVLFQPGGPRSHLENGLVIKMLARKTF